MKYIREHIPFVLLLSVFAISSGAAMTEDSQTSDEAVHLAAGVSHLMTGDRRMNPEHPPLAKLVSALPFLFVDAPLPLGDRSWKDAREWSFGTRFLYRNRLQADTMLLLGRAPVLVAGLALLVLIFVWAHRLYGRAGGLLALALGAFSPNLIAHSHYITNDVPVALWHTAAVFALWRYRETRSRYWLLGTGLFVGLALGTKYSAMLLLPLLPIFLWNPGARGGDPNKTSPGVEALSGAHPDTGVGRLSRARAELLQVLVRLAVVGSVAYLVLAAVYQAEPIRCYLEGYFSMQSGWTAFLLGEISDKGWFHYFLVALLVKTPPGTLLLIAFAAASSRYERPRDAEWMLLAAAGWFFLVSSALRINIGIRHILPVYPLLFVFSGRLLGKWVRSRLQSCIAIGLVAWTALEVGIASPHFLSYFSSIAGGPWEGYRYLSDSNLDWGQDMKRLEAWAEQEGLEAMLLGVFSGADPAAYGLEFMPVPGFGAITFRERPLEKLPPRLVLAISAMNLQGVYFEQPGLFATRLPIDRSVYHFLLERPVLERLTPSVWAWDLTDDPEALYRLGAVYLNFGWKHSAMLVLGRYLELRPDDARARRGLARLAEALGADAAESIRDVTGTELRAVP